MNNSDENKTCNYFVDEAGDAVIFGKGKKLQVGKNNCPRFFFLGLLEVDNPKSLTNDLENLRKDILSDPNLSKLPGVGVKYNKTCEKFHAVDDPPITRRIAYDFISKRDDLRFICVLKDKLTVYNYIKLRSANDADYYYIQGELYDYCARRLFKGKLHVHNHYQIFFAKWKQSERKRELMIALEIARERFFEEHQIKKTNSIDIDSCFPIGIGGLQIVDYYLWALQRIYEIQDDSYFNLIKDKYGLILDIDDIRKKGYGEYYTKKSNPLTLKKVSERL